MVRMLRTALLRTLRATFAGLCMHPKSLILLAATDFPPPSCLVLIAPVLLPSTLSVLAYSLCNTCIYCMLLTGDTVNTHLTLCVLLPHCAGPERAMATRSERVLGKTRLTTRLLAVLPLGMLPPAGCSLLNCLTHSEQARATCGLMLRWARVT